MSLVYLQSMYSESCFSECSRNKQQALFLLRVSKPESAVRRVFHGAVLLWPGSALLPWLLLLKGSEVRLARAHAHPPPPPHVHPAAFLAPTCHGDPGHSQLLLAQLCHHPGHIFCCLQPSTPKGAGMLLSLA